jgi:hypothetical protein
MVIKKLKYVYPSYSTRKGNKYLRSALIEASHSLKGSDNYLGANIDGSQHVKVNTGRQ